MILPADKGNSTVVMNRSEYNDKVNDTLKDGTYCLLKKNPTTKLERTINKRLKAPEKKGEIDDRLRKKITPQHSYRAQLYGLPKIHKPGVPLCPIVSSIGSATYNLAKELTRIPTPLKGSSDSYIKNSAHFVKKIVALDLHDNDVMVSFDMKSLFTRVPACPGTLAMHVIKERLAKDETLDE